MELNLGYKQTEAGVIPEEWQISYVGVEFDIKLGKMLDAEKNIGVPKLYLGNRAVQWGKIDISDLASVRLSHSDLSRFRLKKGDLLVCEGGEVGRAAIWEAPLPECYYQKALHRLRPIKKYDPLLMLYVLMYWSDRGKLTNYVTQTSIAHLTREKFEVVPLLLPPLPEQRAIAAALSDMDALLAAQDQLIAKKRDIKQAVMQQLLTGKQRLAGFSGEWELKRMEEIFDITAGSSKSRYIKDVGRYLVVDMGSISIEGKLIASKPTNYFGDFLKRGDLVMPKDDIGGGNIIGKVAYIDKDQEYVLGDHVYALKAKMGNSLFLSYAINSHTINSALRKKVSGSAQLGLGRKSVEEQHILFPSPDEQTAIAAVLSDMDAEIDALQQRRDKTQMLKQGMMQELLTGRTRLV